MVNTQSSPVDIRQPQANDIVGDPVYVCGVGTGQHGEITIRLIDGQGTEIFHDFYRVSQTGAQANFCVSVPLSSMPATAQGTLEISTGTGPDVGPDAVIPVIFGKMLIDSYGGFWAHTVEEGETLSAIAEQHYSDPGQYHRIVKANPEKLDQPDHIAPGQMLRVPVGSV